MCEPVSMIMMAMSAASAVGGLAMAAKSSKPQQPPQAKLPERAVDAPVNRGPGAIVRLGTGKMDEADDSSAEPMYQGGSGVRRNSGSTLGNLGKSSLI